MTEEDQTPYERILYFPNCPFNKSVLQWILRLGLIVLATVGLSFLNFWVSVVYLVYAVGFFFWAMPLKHCKYCYYVVKDNEIDKKNGKTVEKLLPLDIWKESHFKKHVDCGKKWGYNFLILLFAPIVLIIISLFLSFSIIALISLIGFIVLLAIMGIHMKWKVCPTCAFVEECHEAF